MAVQVVEQFLRFFPIVLVNLQNIVYHYFVVLLDYVVGSQLVEDGFKVIGVLDCIVITDNVLAGLECIWHETVLSGGNVQLVAELVALAIPEGVPLFYLFLL